MINNKSIKTISKAALKSINEFRSQEIAYQFIFEELLYTEQHNIKTSSEHINISAFHKAEYIYTQVRASGVVTTLREDLNRSIAEFSKDQKTINDLRLGVINNIIGKLNLDKDKIYRTYLLRRNLKSIAENNEQEITKIPSAIEITTALSEITGDTDSEVVKEALLTEMDKPITNKMIRFFITLFVFISTFLILKVIVALVALVAVELELVDPFKLKMTNFLFFFLILFVTERYASDFNFTGTQKSRNAWMPKLFILGFLSVLFLIPTIAMPEYF